LLLDHFQATKPKYSDINANSPSLLTHCYVRAQCYKGSQICTFKIREETYAHRFKTKLETMHIENAF